MTDPKLALIAARDRKGIIGRDGQLPWRLGDDLAFFKSATMNAPIIMGRKTWESLPRRPLPGRSNIVLSRDWTYAAPGARVYSGFVPASHAALSIAARAGSEWAFVIGGASLYEAALTRADRMLLTEVNADIDGDTSFPDFDERNWRETGRWRHERSERNEYAFTIRQMDRIK